MSNQIEVLTLINLKNCLEKLEIIFAYETDDIKRDVIFKVITDLSSEIRTLTDLSGHFKDV
ncbi:hypothetical protein D9K79_17955 [Acinetobacter cumulans]|uniref:Uncharacterized protein n=1 Tax=Acinetobacter cumulans TaxID=2136182 RepID=A0ABX9U130_9GAMM|nr:MULTISPECIES: hypothetical protein [Acinetobacter]RLL36271.1 hypothetical protein D9K79_17955 [Acinetobacter cumulans]